MTQALTSLAGEKDDPEAMACSLLLKTSSFSFVVFAEPGFLVLEVGAQDSGQFGKINGLGHAVVTANRNRFLSPANIRAKCRERNHGNVFGIRMIL
jgi:hypothetical protein